MKRIIILFSLITLICSSIFAQETAQKTIDLIITDKENNFVSDIKKEELTLYVDGKAQTDFSIEMQTSPLLYVLAVDNSGSMRVIFGDLIDGGKVIISQNSKNDLTLLMRFISRDKIQVTEKFSSDTKYLHANLDNFFIEGGQTALVDAIYKSAQILAEQDGVGADYRRSIVVISDGEDRESEKTEAQLLELLKKEKVQVFFIGLINELSDSKGFGGKSQREKAKQFIEKITESNGGVALFPKKAEQISETAKQMSTLLRNRYVLKFKMPDNKAAKIEIKSSENSKRKNLNLYFSTN